MLARLNIQELDSSAPGNIGAVIDLESKDMVKALGGLLNFLCVRLGARGRRGGGRGGGAGAERGRKGRGSLCASWRYMQAHGFT